MISSVYWEWELLLLGLRAGIWFAFLYDLVIIFRMLLSHNFWLESLEDLFFWIYVTSRLFQLQLTKSNGVLRGFVVLGVAGGMCFYHIILEKHVNKMAKKGIGFFKRRLTEKWKLFKIKLCKHNCDVKNHRRKNGTKRNSGEKKETE